jgi:hypothetical protein
MVKNWQIYDIAENIEQYFKTKTIQDLKLNYSRLAFIMVKDVKECKALWDYKGTQ